MLTRAPSVIRGMSHGSGQRAYTGLSGKKKLHWSHWSHRRITRGTSLLLLESIYSSSTFTPMTIVLRVERSFKSSHEARAASSEMPGHTDLCRTAIPIHIVFIEKGIARCERAEPAGLTVERKNA